MQIELQTPLTKDKLKTLRAGDQVLISGIIFTARDAAHKLMIETLERGHELPFDIKDQIVYYAGPCPAKPGDVIGSCGPTTSGRMDTYAPQLICRGLTGMIGKGLRSKSVVDAMRECGAVYFGAIGGAGALIAASVISEKVVAYKELGTEAVRMLKVKKFPAVVIIDCEGNNLYDTGKKQYRVID